MYVERFRIDDDRLAGLRVLCQSVDLRAGPGGSRITPLGSIARKAGEQSKLIHGTWHYAAVVALYPSSQLVAHVDPPIVGTRHHVPLAVNPGCWVFHAGTWQQLVEGRVYAMDPTELHGAVNWGSTVRTHLMLDVE